MTSSTIELSHADIASILERCSEVERHVSARNYPAWANCFTEDALFMFAHSPTVKGRAAIEEWGRNGPKVVRLTFSDIEIHRCSDDLAWLTSAYQLVFEGLAEPDVGKQLVLLKRQADGSWKTLAASVSSDLPPPPTN